MFMFTQIYLYGFVFLITVSACFTTAIDTIIACVQKVDNFMSSKLPLLLLLVSPSSRFYDTFFRQITRNFNRLQSFIDPRWSKK